MTNLLDAHFPKNLSSNRVRPYNDRSSFKYLLNVYILRLATNICFIENRLIQGNVFKAMRVSFSETLQNFAPSFDPMLLSQHLLKVPRSRSAEELWKGSKIRFSVSKKFKMTLAMISQSLPSNLLRMLCCISVKAFQIVLKHSISCFEKRLNPASSQHILIPFQKPWCYFEHTRRSTSNPNRTDRFISVYDETFLSQPR